MGLGLQHLYPLLQLLNENILNAISINPRATFFFSFSMINFLQDISTP